MENLEHRTSVDELLREERAEALRNSRAERASGNAPSFVKGNFSLELIGLSLLLLGLGFGLDYFQANKSETGKSRNVKSAIEEYARLPVTNIVAQPGDTMDGMISRYCPELPREKKRYVFRSENDSNGQLTVGRSYKVHVSTNSPAFAE